jgi:hypothetical protein
MFTNEGSLSPSSVNVLMCISEQDMTWVRHADSTSEGGQESKEARRVKHAASSLWMARCF